MRQVLASICIDLPADVFSEATALVEVRPLWEEFLQKLKDAGITCVPKLEVNETRTKPSPPTNGRKRNRQTAGRPTLMPVPPGPEAA